MSIKKINSNATSLLSRANKIETTLAWSGFFLF
jgi:hypothetical protein